MKLSKLDKIRHFTSTAFIVSDNRVLLVNHKKLGKWLPIGGHIEQNETPDHAVKREVKEETGLDIEIVSQKYPDFIGAEMLNKPFTIALQIIDKEHQHIDLQFICKPIGDITLNGTEECKWFTSEELNNLEKCPDVIKHFSKEAIKLLKT